MNKQALTTAFLLILVVIGLHLLAAKFSLYYIFWWYDNLLHIIGGFALGFIGIGLFKKHRVSLTLCFAGGVAILWEVFERLGHVWWPMHIGFGGAWDTLFDILCGILGAAFVLIMTRRK